MKTAKEVAKELGVPYEAFKGFIRAMKAPKFMGVYRFNDIQIERMKRILSRRI